MNLKQLEAFVQVAESGSFSKAAKELFLTQPTISAHISSLEKELNARLFVRNTKEVSLSEDGHLLYKYAKQMVDLEKRIADTFSVGSDTTKQCISIAASTVPAQYLLPQLLAKFSEKYPDEQFKITEMDSAKVVERIVENSVDIGFTGTMIEKKHCKYIPFYRDELIVITPNNARFQERQHKEDDISWITTEPVIMREEGSGTRKEAEKQLRQIGINVNELNVIASIENQETIKRSVSSGMGISIISRLAAKDEIDRQDMLEFSLPLEERGRDLNVVYNKNFHLSVSAERFIKVVKEMYGMKKKA